MKQDNSQIKDEPAMLKLLSRMPNGVANSFTEDQLVQLKLALAAREWGQHKIDCRGTLPIPLMSTKIYYVFLMGRNHRDLSRIEKTVSAFTFALFISIFILLMIIGGVLFLYIIKSALGIDLLEDFSFGLWTYLKGM